MAPNTLAWLWPVLFYLMGSIPTGYLMGKSRGLDIRQHGSGNIGATNVGRVLGRNWGLAAFACDLLKGFLLLFLVREFFFPGTATWQTSLLLVLCGMASILGHNYTPWLGFKGGKGVATTGGVLVALLPEAFLACFAVWALLVLLTRIVSIGSILSAVTLPIATLFFYPHQWVYFVLAVLAGGLIIWRHRSNMTRLLAGTEPRLGTKVASKTIS